MCGSAKQPRHFSARPSAKTGPLGKQFGFLRGLLSLVVCTCGEVGGGSQYGLRRDAVWVGGPRRNLQEWQVMYCSDPGKNAKPYLASTLTH